LNITRVLIAHRMETIASAQRVLMLRDGALIDWSDYREPVMSRAE